MTSASTHDSQVAIPLGTLTAGRVENLYDLMDAAYDSIEIWAHCILLGHKPIIDVNPRRSVEMQEALRREKKARRTLGLFFPEERRYVERSGSERVNGRLKDEFGGRHVRVRGYDKVLAHLMFGMTVLTASQRALSFRRSSPARLLRHHGGRTSRKTVRQTRPKSTQKEGSNDDHGRATRQLPCPDAFAWVFLRRSESIRILQAAQVSMAMGS